MSRHPDPDPLDALRAANPVPHDQLPPASLDRLRARVYEESMRSNTHLQPTMTGLSRAKLGLGAIAALALILVLGANAGTWLAPGGTTGPGNASCVEQYSLATLGNRTFAFDGTVTAIAGERVTFAVNASFRGVTGTSVRLDAPGMTGAAITSAGGPNLVVGGRYLVAGESTFAWPCGFTQPYDAGVASSWSAALGG